MASATPVTGSSSDIPPNRMRAVVTRAAGGYEVLELQIRDRPMLEADQVLIRVVAACVNKIDLLEREELANVILGHECSGIIEEVGPYVQGLQKNDKVSALLRGGGYADYVAVPSSFVFHIPHNIGVEVAPRLPFLTCIGFKAIIECGKLQQGKTLLIHDEIEFGEVGLFAMRMAKALYGTKVIVVCGCDKMLGRYRAYGADHCFEMRVRDYRKGVNSLTDKRGVDVILNYGGSHAKECQECLAVGGFMMVLIDVQNQQSIESRTNDLKRLPTTVTYQVFRVRDFISSEELVAVVERVKEEVWPLIEDGRLTFEFQHKVVSLRDAGNAHWRMEIKLDEEIILTTGKNTNFVPRWINKGMSHVMALIGGLKKRKRD